MPQINVSVAMMQMRVETDALQKNLTHADQLLTEVCYTRQVDFAVFPETADLGWATANAYALAEAVPGGTACEAWRAMAKKHGVYLVAGLTERADDKIYNCAVFFSPDGELLAKHRKINVLQDVEGMYEIGDQLHVVETRFGRVGFDICADNFISSAVLMHAMARMGARMILSPSAWAVTPGYDPVKTPYGAIWTQPYGALSRLYGMPVIGVSNVGTMRSGAWAGHAGIGNSLAYDADGREVARLPFGKEAETVRVVTLTLRDPIAKGTDMAAALLARGYTGQAEQTQNAPAGHGDGSAG